MNQNRIFPVWDLQLFAEGGDGGGVGPGGDGGADGKVQATPDAGTGQAPERAGDPEAEFDRLIQGQFKEAFDRRVRERLKDANQALDRYAALNPVLEAAAKKYGVDPGDPQALKAALERDGPRKPTQAEQADLRQRQQRMQRQRQELAGRQYALWTRQAEEAKKLYPALDMGVEARDPRFRQLLRAGVDVGSAYLVVHKDDILPAAMQHTARVVEQKLADKILAGSARPAENGRNAQSAAMTKSDVSQLTRADREEIRRRVAKGDKIRF